MLSYYGMKEINVTEIGAGYRISPVYEKVFQPEGDGVVGFTIFYSASTFKNHVQFFNATNRALVKKQVEIVHQIYTAKTTQTKTSKG